MFNLNDYEMVEERLKKWWADNPDGRIETELLESSASRFIVKASLYRTEADPKPVATGLAQANINSTKQASEFGLELCETSAIGRALANFTYSGKKRASREEMSRVIRTTPTKFEVENPADPWTTKPATDSTTVPVAEMIKTAFDTAEEVPQCKHGTMVLKEGVGDNGPWHGYMCAGSRLSNVEKCKAVYYEMKPSGKWGPKAPKVTK